MNAASIITKYRGKKIGAGPTGAELKLRRLNKKHLSPEKQAAQRGPNRAIGLNPD